MKLISVYALVLCNNLCNNEVLNPDFWIPGAFLSSIMPFYLRKSPSSVSSGMAFLRGKTSLGDIYLCGGEWSGKLWHWWASWNRVPSLPLCLVSPFFMYLIIKNLPKKVMATLKEMVIELFWGTKSLSFFFFALKIQWIFERDFCKNNNNILSSLS